MQEHIFVNYSINEILEIVHSFMMKIFIYKNKSTKI
jgi:hypothetical protein